MSYPICIECKCRRDPADGVGCQDKSAHKRFVRWVADAHFDKGDRSRLRKRFDSEEAADDQEAAWRTDFKRGGSLVKVQTKMLFEVVADEWWTSAIIVQGKIKNPERSEKSRFDKWVDFFKGRQIRSITTDEIEDWIAERRESGIAINTVNRDLKPLRWIFNYAKKKKYVIDNPLFEFEDLKNGNIHDRWMDEGEVNHFVKTAIEMGDLELADFIAVGVNNGFRLANLESMTARDVSEFLMHARKTKSGKPYSVPVTEAVEHILRRLIQAKPTGPLLIGRANNVGERFRECARKAGLYTSKKDPERVTIHTLRHTYAVLYLTRGGDIYRLSQLLGHASVKVTEQTYGRFCQKEKIREAPLASTHIAGLAAPVLQVV